MKRLTIIIACIVVVLFATGCVGGDGERAEYDAAQLDRCIDQTERALVAGEEAADLAQEAIDVGNNWKREALTLRKQLALERSQR